MKREEQQVVEVQSTPLRNYFMQNVMPTMTHGLIECCRVRPDDPIDFLVLIPYQYSVMWSETLVLLQDRSQTNIIRSWSWSCELWSWSCSTGLGLVNSVLVLVLRAMVLVL